MNSPLTIGIKDLLEAGEVGTFGASEGWSICIGRLINNPDTIVMVKSLPGQPPNPKWLLDYPSAQVIVRGNETGYLEAHAKAQKVKNLLLGLPSQDLNGDRWVQINMAGDIADLGQDEKQRPMFSLNFQLIIEPAVSSDSNREPL